MIRFNVSHDTRTRYEYKVKKNGETTVKSYTDAINKKSYPIAIVIGAEPELAVVLFDRYIEKIGNTIPFTVEYDEELKELHARILYPRDFDSELSAGEQRNAVISHLRAEAKIVKKSI